MKKLMLLLVVGCSFSLMLSAGDAEFTQKLVGTWNFAYTNATAVQSTQTMVTVTEYRPDGTFVMKGEVSETAPVYPPNTMSFVERDGLLAPESDRYPFRRQIGGVGIWRIERGYLLSTLTNSVGNWRMDTGSRSTIQTNTASLQTDVERKEEIISMTAQKFTKRNTAGQELTATRKE